MVTTLPSNNLDVDNSPKRFNSQRSWVIANWKMNPVNKATCQQLVNDIIEQPSKDNCNIVIAPNFLHLSSVTQVLKDTNIGLAAQNLCSEAADKGAFTGEISAAQLADLGVQFVIIGHSERRQYYAENNNILINKIKNAIAQNMSVIFCIGETHEQYLAKQTLQIIQEQLDILKNFAQLIASPAASDNFSPPKLLIAYEPVWAIGTGLTPSLEEIESTHNYINQLMRTLGIHAPILYGGSVNEKNAAEIAKIPVVDGALVGGASLKADSFYQIIDAFAQK